MSPNEEVQQQHASQIFDHAKDRFQQRKHRAQPAGREVNNRDVQFKQT
jgi:hypothetical protein